MKSPKKWHSFDHIIGGLIFQSAKAVGKLRLFMSPAYKFLLYK